MNAIVSIGVVKMCSCTSCGTYCTHFCSYTESTVATETCSVGTAKGAAAHFCDTNQNYGIQRSYHQNFNYVLYQIRYLQSFEVDICLKLHILAGTTKSAVFQQKTHKKLYTNFKYLVLLDPVEYDQK